MEINKNENESFLQYTERLTHLLLDGVVDYETWSRELVGDVVYSDETLRRCAVFLNKVLRQIDDKELAALNDEQRVLEIQEATDKLLKERKKLQAANVEYNANIRGEARYEMFNERINEAIANLPKIAFTTHTPRKPEMSTGVLCIADAHNGVEINMQSLFGETVNVYSPDVLKARLSSLLNKVVNDSLSTFNYDKLIVFDLGDGIQNILRMSDLAKLRTGVVESTLDYAETIANFLNELSERLQIPVEYVCLGGNHAELRLLTTGRNWEEENLGRVIREFIYLRLKDNPNITVDPYSEFGYKNVQGINILAIHGDGAKNDFEEISYWENYHNISIDILLMGHVHHGEQNTVGYGLTGDKEVIKVPSLVGVDTFSKKCRKLARAGAKFMLFEDGEKTWERNYCLN